MSRAAIVADLVRMQARQLKMPGLARGFEDLARHAREEHWSHEDYLHDILAAEINSRAESAVKQRVRSAGFPEIKTLDEFDFAIADGVDLQRSPTCEGRLDRRRRERTARRADRNR